MDNLITTVSSKTCSFSQLFRSQPSPDFYIVSIQCTRKV